MVAASSAWTTSRWRRSALRGRLHDIGKIGVREEILNKHGPLTDEEFEQVKTHPVTGSDILAPTHLGKVIEYVRNHHERWDGRGYPDGLAGAAIPMGARIIGAVEIYDALTPRGPTRKDDAELAVEQQRLGGTVIDPAVRRALQQVIARREALIFCGRRARIARPNPRPASPRHNPCPGRASRSRIGGCEAKRSPTNPSLLESFRSDGSTMLKMSSAPPD